MKSEINVHINVDHLKEHVLFFIPNLVDYVRLICTVLAFYYARSHPNTFLFLYFFSYLLDEFDGMLARRYNQTSHFGGILDMIIDRISTSALLGLLAMFYPDQFYIFLCLMMLDIGSHWLQTHSALIENAGNGNHKALKEPYWLLEVYYKSRLALSIIGWSAEIFLGQIYYLFFFKDSFNNPLFLHIMYITFPFYIVKQIISILQIKAASDRIIRIDMIRFEKIKLNCK